MARVEDPHHSPILVRVRNTVLRASRRPHRKTFVKLAYNGSRDMLGICGERMASKKHEKRRRKKGCKKTEAVNTQLSNYNM